MINDLHIGPLTVHMYGVMVAIGYMSALLISERRARKQGLNPDILFGIFWCAVLGGAAGSKALYYMGMLSRYFKRPVYIMEFSKWVGGVRRHYRRRSGWLGLLPL